MRLQTLLLSLASLLPWQQAAAVGPADTGIYRVVNGNGEVTSQAMRLSQAANRWLMEERRPDGSWASVSCEKDCTLQASSEYDIRRFFPAAALARITPDCIHNIAFAFCGYSLKTDAAYRSHAFVVLLTNPPRSVRLQRGS
jgi:hypothetical protein